jgi:para-nitrobenzyl esterase
LRSLPVATILANATESSYNQSTVDGRVLPEPQLAALALGHFNKVPVIQGANSHEGRFFFQPTVSETEYFGVVMAAAAESGKSVDLILTAYPLSAYPNPFEAVSALYGDALFACGALVSNQLLGQWTATYAHEFDDAAASPLGATHSAELRYLFNLGDPAVGPAGLPPPSQLLGSTMREYWTQFARSGNPNGSVRSDWQPLSDGNIQVLTTPTVKSDSVSDYDGRHRCTFWRMPS